MVMLAVLVDLPIVKPPKVLPKLRLLGGQVNAVAKLSLTDSTVIAPVVLTRMVLLALASKVRRSAWIVMLEELAVDEPDNTVKPSEPMKISAALLG